MRRCLALLALAVTTWSNVTVLRCAHVIVDSRATETAAAVGHHGHAGHGSDRQDVPPPDDGPDSHPAGNDCGVVMACGTALGGQGAAAERGLPATVGEIANAAVASPSAADLTRDPPPPRRHA